jgi:kinesin family protein 2/24
MKNAKTPRIMVTIRKRPLTKKEIAKGEKDIVSVDGSYITVAEDREKLDLTKYVEYHRYKFDRIYDQTISNSEVRSLDL